MNSDMFALMGQVVDLTKALCDLKARAEIAEVKLSASEERCKMLLEAKNFWMDRALAAEKKLAATPDLRSHL